MKKLLEVPIRSVVDFIAAIQDFVAPFTGSMVYFLHSVFYRKTTLIKASVSLFIGGVVSIYVSPQVIATWPWVNRDCTSFIIGMLGMRITEVLLEYDIKALFATLVQSILPKK